MMSANASDDSSADSDSPNASRRTADCSASAIRGGEQSIDELRARHHPRDHQTKKADTLHVLLDEHAPLGADGQVDDAEQLTVVDQWEADERSGGEVFEIGRAHV